MKQWVAKVLVAAGVVSVLSACGGGGGGFRFGRGGGGSSVTPLNSKVTGLSRNVSGSFDAPGNSDRQDLEEYQKSYQDLKSKVDQWFAENWDKFLEEVGKYNFSPIGDN